MPHAQFESLEGDSLSEYEVSKLRQLAPSDAGGEGWTNGLSRVEDVAEATGQSEEQVRAQLRTIRAEQAFAESSPGFRLPVLPLAAMGALALGVAYIALHQSPKPVRKVPYRARHAYPSYSSSQPPSPVPYQVREPANLESLGIVQHQEGPEAPPPGLSIDILGRLDCSGYGVTANQTPPLNYEAECRWLARSAEALALREVQEEPHAVQRGPGPYQDRWGRTFKPRKGYLYYVMEGWPGNVSGWIPSKLDDGARAQLLEAARKLLRGPKQEQDSALDLLADPSQGVLSPPPGFTVEFYGRRFDRQVGPHISFVPLDPRVVRARLELAVRNAVIRDGKPPIGRWTEDRATEAKIPRPQLSHVEITGPTGSWKFDLPTSHGWGSDTAAALRSQTEPAIRQIHESNRLTKHEPSGQ